MTIRRERVLIAISAEITPDRDGDDRLYLVGSNGLFLAGNDHDAVWRDLGPALQAMLRKNEGWPKPKDWDGK
jgi:hypothetical protein